MKFKKAVSGTTLGTALKRFGSANIISKHAGNKKGMKNKRKKK